ncbi:MAG: hypothetical protein ABI746_04515 [Dermatophilaceae bacterium]
MSMTFIVLTGWGQREWYQYLTWAYNRATIVFGLFALVLPVTRPPGVRERSVDAVPHDVSMAWREPVAWPRDSAALPREPVAAPLEGAGTA